MTLLRPSRWYSNEGLFDVETFYCWCCFAFFMIILSCMVILLCYRAAEVKHLDTHYHYKPTRDVAPTFGDLEIDENPMTRVADDRYKP